LNLGQLSKVKDAKTQMSSGFLDIKRDGKNFEFLHLFAIFVAVTIGKKRLISKFVGRGQCKE